MNKGLKVFFGLIIALIIVWGIVFFVDYARCANLRMPIFVVAGETADDGGSGIYYGLGYKVKIEKNLSVEYGVQLESVEMYMFNKFITGAIAEIQKDTVIITNGKIQNEHLIEKFINSASIDSTEAQTLIIHEYTSEDEYVVKQIKFVPSTYSENIDEDRTITINTDDVENLYGHFIYTINNDENTEKTFSYKWWLKRYTKDGIVSLRFETFMDVTEFPVICSYSLESSNYTKKFELNYYQRKDKGLKTIIDKNDNPDYEYSVYTFGGDVNFTFETDMVYTFEKAIEQKILTVEDILTQARMDADYGICEKGYYSDGGSTEFLYEDYTILKYSTLDGLEDLVIGYKGQIINEVNQQIDK